MPTVKNITGPYRFFFYSANYEIIGDGEGVHWPDIDEDISAEGMLSGTPAPRPKRHADKPTT